MNASTLDVLEVVAWTVGVMVGIVTLSLGALALWRAAAGSARAHEGERLTVDRIAAYFPSEAEALADGADTISLPHRLGHVERHVVELRRELQDTRGEVHGLRSELLTHIRSEDERAKAQAREHHVDKEEAIREREASEERLLAAIAELAKTGRTAEEDTPT